jgi:REP-associated tyrosine transposase
MANTYTQIYIRYVFVVKHRTNLILNFFKDELYKYITGIEKNKDHKLIAINGIPNHIHIFIGMRPIESVSDLARDIKANSSGFINDKKFSKGRFEWQSGFAAFSYSHSQIDNVVKYIMNQEEHHKVKTFKEEYLEMLNEFNIDYDEKYLFEDVD